MTKKNIFKGKIIDKKLEILSSKDFNSLIESLDEQEVEIHIIPKKKNRTSRQNASLHLWYTHVSDTLNEHGIDVKVFFDFYKTGEIEHAWSPELVKEIIWRPVQKSVTRKTSTTQLTTDEIDKIFDPINKLFGEKFGIFVDFPSIEGLITREELT